MTDVLSAEDPGVAERVTDELRAGLVAVVPTDTVYGVAADAFAPAATRRLMRARGGGRNRPVPVVIRTPYQVGAVARDVGPAAQRLMDRFWPGPLTLVLWAVSGLGADLGNAQGTVQLRMVADPFLADLVKRIGPLALSGAHRRGRPRPTTVEEAREQLGTTVTCYVDGGRLDGPPSTIVDARTGQVTVLRQGAIAEADIEAVAADEPTPRQEHGGDPHDEHGGQQPDPAPPETTVTDPATADGTGGD